MSVSLERLYIAVYAIYLFTKNKITKQPKNNRVLIIFQQVFGDSIILLPALEGYMELYNKHKGYEVTMICRSSIKKFLHDTAKIPKNLNIEIVDFKRLVDDFYYFREIAKKYNRFAEISIVAGTSFSAELLSTTLCSKERYGLISCFKIKWPLQMAIFQRIAYTNTVIPPVGMMMIQRHRLMLNHLGLPDYKGKLSSLLPQDKVIEGRYCVICPGASTSIKMWPINRFTEIADWIIDKYDIDVHLCGGPSEKETSLELISDSINKNRIFNHVGETTYKEWLSIIQYAELVIGNDSATLHMAVAARRKSICVAGVYDKFQFFPYLVDELNTGDYLPITLVKDMPCAYCRTKGYFAGYGNPVCKATIKKGNCALCIEDIRVDDVKEAIINFLA